MLNRSGSEATWLSEYLCTTLDVNVINNYNFYSDHYINIETFAKADIGGAAALITISTPLSANWSQFQTTTEARYLSQLLDSTQLDCP